MVAPSSSSGLASTSELYVLDNISALEAATTTSLPGLQVLITGYYSNADGGEGIFSVGTAATANGGTIIEDASGRTWYRETGGQPYSAKWFGAQFNGSNNDTTFLLDCATAAAAAGAAVYLPAGTTLLGAITFPAIASLTGAGNELTEIIVTGTATSGSAIFNFTNPVEISGFTVLAEGTTYSSNPIINGESISNGYFSVSEISIAGTQAFGIRAYSCSRVLIKKCIVNSQTSESQTGIYVEGSGDGEISSCFVGGVYNSHSIQVQSSKNFRVFSNYISVNSGATTGDFGISFYENSGCMMWGNAAFDTYLEAFQLTSCQQCSISNSYAQWDNSSGVDFGSSMEQCNLCSINGNFYLNSYKAAVGVAADAAESQGNKIYDNVTFNCATRGTASGAGGTAAAVFTVYTTSTYANSSNDFVNNLIYIGPGETVTYGFLEVALGTSGTLATNKFRDATIVVAGNLSEEYSVSGNQSYVWMDKWTTWNPTVTAGSGSFSALGTIVANYIQVGPIVSFNIAIPIITNGTAGGSVLATLPVVGRSNITSVGSGRENAVTGVMLQAINANGSEMEIFTYNNAYPGGSGCMIYVSGYYQLP